MGKFEFFEKLKDCEILIKKSTIKIFSKFSKVSENSKKVCSIPKLRLASAAALKKLKVRKKKLKIISKIFSKIVPHLKLALHVQLFMAFRRKAKSRLPLAFPSMWKAKGVIGM